MVVNKTTDEPLRSRRNKAQALYGCKPRKKVYIMKKFFETMIFMEEGDQAPDNIQKYLNIALLITSSVSILISISLLIWLILT